MEEDERYKEQRNIYLRPKKGFVTIPSGEVMRFLRQDGKPVKLSLVYGQDQLKQYTPINPECDDHPSFKRTEIIIFSDELEKFKAKYPELAGRDEKTQTSAIDPLIENQLDPIKAITGWKAIGEKIGVSTDYAKDYCRKNGIRIEHNQAGKPWTTDDEIALSRTTK